MPGPASAASASSTVIGAPTVQLRLCAASFDRCDRGGASGACSWRSPPRRAKASRHHHQRDQRRRGDPERDRRLAAGDPERRGDREADPRDRLHQHEAAVQGEVLVSRQPAAREVAGRVGERADDQHVVERAVAVEDFVDQLLRAAPARRPGRSARSRPGSRSGRAAGVRACRVRGGRRSCARAAVRSAGRSPRSRRTSPTTARPGAGLTLPRARGWRSRRTRTSSKPGRGDPDRAGSGAAPAARERERRASSRQSRTSSIVQGNGERTSATWP